MREVVIFVLGNRSWVYAFLEIHTSSFWFIVYSLFANTNPQIIFLALDTTYLHNCNGTNHIKYFLPYQGKEWEYVVFEIFSYLKDSNEDNKKEDERETRNTKQNFKMMATILL